MEAANPWAMLLRTFLPWVNAGQIPDYNHQDEDGRAEDDESAADAGAEVAEDGNQAHEEDDLD